MSFSFRLARETNDQLSEASADVVAALDAEEKAWLLRAAARFQQATAVKTLLVARASANQVTRHHTGGAFSALHEACRCNTEVDILQLLLESRGDPELKTHCKANRRTALAVAEAEGHVNLVRCLQESSTTSLGIAESVGSKAAPTTPMPSQEAGSGSVPTASFRQTRQLLEHVTEEDASVLVALGAEERAWMLRVAAGYNQVSAAKALLCARASVDHVTRHSTGGVFNALHGACMWNASTEMVQLLLQARADTNIKAHYRGQPRTALQIAAVNRHDDLVQCFPDARWARPSGSGPAAAAWSWESSAQHAWSATGPQSWNSSADTWGGYSQWSWPRAEGKEASTWPSPEDGSAAAFQPSSPSVRPTETSSGTQWWNYGSSDGWQSKEASSFQDATAMNSSARSASDTRPMQRSRSPTAQGSSSAESWRSHNGDDGWSWENRGLPSLPWEEDRDWDVIETVQIHRVAYLQNTCSAHFKDGRPLQQTVDDLKQGRVDPMTHKNFILNGLKSNVKHEGRWQDLYWTQDHRRLLCMRRAGCTHVRVRLRPSDRSFTPIVRKMIARLGHDTTIQVLGEASTQAPN